MIGARTDDCAPGNWIEPRWKHKDIAHALGVTEGAGSQGMNKAKKEGKEALRHQPPPGPHPKLSEDQFDQLPELRGLWSPTLRLCG